MRTGVNNRLNCGFQYLNASEFTYALQLKVSADRCEAEVFDMEMFTEALTWQARRRTPN